MLPYRHRSVIAALGCALAGLCYAEFVSDVSGRRQRVCLHLARVRTFRRMADRLAARARISVRRRVQTRQILAGIDALLAEVGSDKSKLLQVTVWLTSMSNYDAFNSVWDAWIGPGQAPARACVEARLARPGWLVEVLVVAAL